MNHSRQARLADLGEFHIIRSFLRSLGSSRSEVEVGPGDDSAVLRLGKQHLVLSVDAQIEDTHFRWPWLTPFELGRRCFHVSVSDLAAMGATPRWLLVHYTAPADLAPAQLRGVQRGLTQAAAAHRAAVIGGNLSRGKLFGVVVTALGTIDARPLTRKAARPGDWLFVSGTLGDAASAVRAWTAGGQPAAALRRRFVHPLARVAMGRRLAAAGLAHAAIDLSDGLMQDLGHICRASGVGAVVDPARLPLSAAYRRSNGDDLSLALRGGEDYELLCAIPESNAKRIAALARALGCPMTHIGWFTAGRRARLLGRTPPQQGGFDHFTA